MIIKEQTYRFNKENTGRWYIDLPDYKGNHADLEMVEGADTMLDFVGNGSSIVYLTLSEFPFEDAAELKLLHDFSEHTGGGGIYVLETYNNIVLNQEMWLCEVTEWLFGKLPHMIYFKKEEKQ